MKRSIIYKVFGIAALAFAAFGVISCSEKESEPAVEPIFPEMVTNNEIEPGQTIYLTFVPNMDWTVSIPEESFKWFKILDNKFEEQSVSGKASRLSQRITITTASDKSFSLRSCKVNMTMGGQTKVIASYTIKAENRVVEVYPAAYSENGFSFSDGAYEYDAKAMTSEDAIELVWDENENVFMFPVNVKSNFEWTATWPEWARADINAETRIGDVPIVLYGIDSKLPYDAMEGVVTFKNGDEPFVSFKIKIPGIRDKFEANIGGATSLTFDHAAYYRADAGTFSKDPVEGSIYGPKESRVEVLELTESGYVQAQQDTWLKVDVSSWDNVAGAAVLQNRSISVTVDRYAENKERKAMILLLPATAPADLAELFADGGMSQIKSEYAQYAVPVTQLARPTEYFTFESSEADREFAGLLFARAESALLPQKNFTYAVGADIWQYDLTHCKTLASTKSAVNLTEPYETVEIYDAEGNKIATDALAEHWLNYEQLGDVMYGQIIMIEENLPRVELVGEDGKPVLDEDGNPVKVKVEEIDGYVVFRNDQNEVLSVVHCFYVKEEMPEEDQLEEASAEVFANPSEAAAAGVTAYKLVAGPTYQEYLEFQAPVYVLTCTKDNQTVTVNTSVECTLYSCQGKQYGPEMITVDNQIYYDPVIAERLAKYSEAVEAYDAMKAKDPSYDPDGTLKPKYPDVSDERSTMGNLNCGETIDDERVYPGYSQLCFKKPQGSNENTIREVLQFGTSSKINFIFICNLDLTGAAKANKR